METQTDSNEEAAMAVVKDMRKQLETRIESQHTSQAELFSSLQTLIPDIVSSVDLSLKVISLFNNRPFTPTPSPPPNPNFKKPKISKTSISTPREISTKDEITGDIFTIDDSGSPLKVVRSMVAVCLLHRVPFTEIDSSIVLRNLENDHSSTDAEKAALRELGGESGAILAVEMALRSMAEDNGSVNLKEFDVNGKSRVMILGIDRTRLLKELPESSQQQDCSSQTQKAPANSDGNLYPMGGQIARPMMPEVWGPMYPAAGGGTPGPMMVGPRGGGGPRGMMGMAGMPRGMMGVQNLQRPQMVNNASMNGSNAIMPVKMKSEEDELKDLEAMLSKKSFKELQKSKTGEELLDLIHRPTTKETDVAAKFKTKAGTLRVRISSSAMVP